MIDSYKVNLNSQDLKKQVKIYFETFNKDETYQHTLDVVNELDKIHKFHDIDYDRAYKACLLHDIGRVVKKEDLIAFCEEQGHEFLEGERDLPNILHQIASRILAEKVFYITDPDILSAVQCHTTLKNHPSYLEEVVFLADKLSWKEKVHEESVMALKSLMENSIEAAIYHYLAAMHSDRHNMICYHNWSRDAYNYYNKRQNQNHVSHFKKRMIRMYKMTACLISLVVVLTACTPLSVPRQELIESKGNENAVK